MRWPRKWIQCRKRRDKDEIRGNINICLEGLVSVLRREGRCSSGRKNSKELRGTSFVPGIVLGALYTASHDHSQYLKLYYIKY